MEENVKKNLEYSSATVTDKISIIIPFYNCRYVTRAIASALNQSYKNIEIIVVDDGSTKYTSMIEPFLKNITYIKKGNGGTASALNEGIKRATGDYFVWLSSDDELHPLKVALQLDFMKKQNANISYTNFIRINSNSLPTSSVVNKKFPDKISFYKALKNRCPINGSTVMIKVNLFSDIGLFDESLIYAHDYDFWIRAALKYDIPCLDQPLTSYRVHRQMGSRKHTRAMQKEALKIQRLYSVKLDEMIAKEQGLN